MIMYYKKLLQNKTLFRSLCPLIAGLMLCLAGNTATAQFVFKSDLTGAGVSKGSIAFADVDKDGDEDVLITGDDNTRPIAKLYINDGSGGFIEALGTPFTGVEYSSIAFADVDKDEYQDVLITGEHSGGNAISRLYINDGSGGFTESGTSFTGVSGSSIAFADVDGDGYEDVFVTGSDIAKLYINDGSGGFTESGMSFTGVSGSSAAFSDMDKDGDQDVFVTGFDGSNQTAKLYTNQVFLIVSEPIVEVPENMTEVLTVMTTDTDVAVNYSLSGGADRSSFDIDMNSGALTFQTNPDFEVPGSTNGDNTYDVEVTVQGGTRNITQTFTITVTDVNEAPVFAGGTVTFTIDEDADVNDDVGTPVTATDEDRPSQTLTYSITAGNDNNDFKIKANTGLIAVAKKLDHEAKGTYTLTVRADDGNGGTADATVTITVDDVNDPPVIGMIPSDLMIAENVSSGNVGSVIPVTDQDRPSQTLTYALSGTNHNDFAIDDTGQITVARTLDHETTDEYMLTLTVTDDGDGTLSDSKKLILTVTNVNDAPVIGTIPLDLTIAENAGSGSNVGSVISVTDQDRPPQMLTYALSGTNHNDFAIDNTGQITVTKMLDHETTDEYTLTLTVTDDGNGTLSDSKDLTITVTDVNDAPMITSAAGASVPENTVNVLRIEATDEDEGTTIIYTISGGADEDSFSIVENSGDLTFRTASDFEAPGSANGDNTYEVVVTASDGTNNISQTFTITVTNVNDNIPAITSDNTKSVAENTTAVLTVVATDADANTTIRYSVSGGANEDSFSIVENSGELTFKTAPDFEAPSSNAGNNTFEVEVTASDGPNNVSQNLTVTVTDVNEAPVITSLATVSMVEGNTDVLTVTATDEDAGTTITYTISRGADESKFNINESSGELTFRTAPDFENPGSADDDNIYEVVVAASDGSNNVSQTLTITVIDDPRLPSAKGVNIYPNPVFDSQFRLKDISDEFSRVILMGLEGREVRHYLVSKDGLYDISGMSEGIFFIFTEGSGGRKYIGKILIRK